MRSWQPLLTFKANSTADIIELQQNTKKKITYVFFIRQLRQQVLFICLFAGSIYLFIYLFIYASDLHRPLSCSIFKLLFIKTKKSGLSK